MHESYKVYPVDKIQTQIESLAAFENTLIIGTRQGFLLTYSIQPNVEESKVDIQLLHFNKIFSKKPIVQLEVVPELKMLFSLSDNVVMVNDINKPNTPLLHCATKTKYATVFAIDSLTSKSLTGDVTVLVRLCVAVRKSLQLW